jgi:hypothetical protein
VTDNEAGRRRSSNPFESPFEDPFKHDSRSGAVGGAAGEAAGGKDGHKGRGAEEEGGEGGRKGEGERERLLENLALLELIFEEELAAVCPDCLATSRCVANVLLMCC